MARANFESYFRATIEELLDVSDTGPGLDETHAESLSIDADSSEAEVQNDYSLDHNTAFSKLESHGEGIGLLIVRHLCRHPGCFYRSRHSARGRNYFQNHLSIGNY